MTRAGVALAALVPLVTPVGVAAQCAIDVIESGIEAYRELELRTAQRQLDSALALNESSAAQCPTENATALAYLGATYWLLERPADARGAFERAVIQAPRFRPDALEFPPDMTEEFERVRVGTPSVAVEMPREAVIGPNDTGTLDVRLTASASHWVTVSVLDETGNPRRTLFQGPVEAGGRGMALEWNGRDSVGEPVPSGWYDLEVVSEDRRSRPVRKVVTRLQVESDAPLTAAGDLALDTAVLFPPVGRRSGGGLGKALAVLGAGLAGGALVFAAPEILDRTPRSEVRYGVAGSLGVAGIVGFIQQIRGRGGDEPPAAPAGAGPGVGPEGAPPAPTLTIRPGVQRRVELGEGNVESTGGSGAATAPSTN